MSDNCGHDGDRIRLEYEGHGHTLDQSMRAALREYLEVVERVSAGPPPQNVHVHLVSVTVNIGRDLDDWHSGEIVGVWGVVD